MKLRLSTGKVVEVVLFELTKDLGYEQNWTSDLKWNDLDNAWAGNYIREAEKIFVDQQVRKLTYSCNDEDRKIQHP
ncbi:unnamed protein product [Rhizophagus irregularis]|nr:unnamed protein product [Rhizophagus irregularis]